jgi:hypothetical protein
MLGLVWITMSQAGRPDSWNWLWRWSGQTSPVVAFSRPNVSENDRGSGLPPGLDTAIMTSVRDDGHFRPEEQSAWFSIWQVLRDTPPDGLRAVSLGDVSYLQIFRQTNELRGRVVDLRGIVRRAHRVQAPHNELGIQGYWQCWLFPHGSPDKPIVVYLLNAPEHLRESMTLEEPASLTGIVYKRWSYLAVKGAKVAPVVLARAFTTLGHPSQPTGHAVQLETSASTVLVVVGVAVLSLIFVAWTFRHTARQYGSANRSASLPVTITVPPEGDKGLVPGSLLSAERADEPSSATPPRAGAQPQ